MSQSRLSRYGSSVRGRADCRCARLGPVCPRRNSMMPRRTVASAPTCGSALSAWSHSVVCRMSIRVGMAVVSPYPSALANRRSSMFGVVATVTASGRVRSSASRRPGSEGNRARACFACVRWGGAVAAPPAILQATRRPPASTRARSRQARPSEKVARPLQNVRPVVRRQLRGEFERRQGDKLSPVARFRRIRVDPDRRDPPEVCNQLR